MAEKPIIFSGPIVRAILDGRKTQTRRVWSRKQSSRRWWDVANERDDDGWPIAEDDCGRFVRIPCPYGKPGDTLWVRETWQINHYDWIDGTIPKSRPENIEWYQLCYRATEDDPEICAEMPWRPSIFMPRWASRITLRVTNVRVERLQDISEEDAIAEGCTAHGPGLCTENPDDYFGCWSAKTAFRKLWDTINAKRAPWESNPWVWVIEFERDAEGES